MIVIIILFWGLAVLNILLAIRTRQIAFIIIALVFTFLLIIFTGTK